MYSEILFIAYANNIYTDLDRHFDESARSEIKTLKKHVKEVNGMSGVRLREGESFDSLMKRFRKVLAKDGILQDVKRVQFYEKPSERRKKELLAARRRLLRKMKREG